MFLLYIEPDFKLVKAEEMNSCQINRFWVQGSFLYVNERPNKPNKIKTSYPSTDEGIKYAHMYNGVLVIQKQEWNPFICSKRNGAGRHVKWNEPDTDVL